MCVFVCVCFFCQVQAQGIDFYKNNKTQGLSYSVEWHNSPGNVILPLGAQNNVYPVV